MEYFVLNYFLEEFLFASYQLILSLFLDEWKINDPLRIWVMADGVTKYFNYLGI